MTAKQTVFITEDRKTAVPQGDARARFKLVHAGQEISDAEVAKYEGAAELIQSEAKAPKPSDPKPPEERKIETREPKTTDRDPKHRER